MKKTGLSRPMTLDVLLPPFTESFQIVASDAVSQWHYDQDGSYLPDRAITPLLLTPELSVFDPETKLTYEPSFYKIRWYLLNSTTGDYDTEITNTEDGDVDYVVLPSGALKVKKNVNELAPVNLLCKAQYVDPRNAGKTYTITETQQLTTNRDSSVTSPTIEIAQESTVKYNPFIDGYTTDQYGVKHHTFTFNATARMGDEVLDVTSQASPYRIRWYAVGDGTNSEALVDDAELVGGISIAKFPCYVSGQGTPTLVVDAMMTDSIMLIARVVNTDTGRVYPEKCLRHLTWDSFKVDATSEAIDGGAVKQDTMSKTFRNIVTMRNRTLSEAAVNENFLQEWKFRNAAMADIEDLGTGPTMTIEGNKLHAQASALVYANLSLFEGYKVVLSDGKVVVSGGRVVVSRY